MLRKVLLAAVLAVMLISGSIATAPATAKDQTDKNDVSVSVLDWHSNPAYLNNTYNVSFRVSFDINGDGTYEDIFTSGTYINKSSLANPFEAHAYVHNSTPSIDFKVEVLESDNVTTPMVNGSGPVHTVPNRRTPPTPGPTTTSTRPRPPRTPISSITRTRSPRSINPTS